MELEDELEGLLHVSELADHKVEHPEAMVNIGEELEVRVLRVDTADRKIGLSCRSDEEIRAQAAAEADGTGAPAGGDSDSRTREGLKGGMGAGAGPLFSLGADESSPAAEEASEPTADNVTDSDPAEESE